MSSGRSPIVRGQARLCSRCSVPRIARSLFSEALDTKALSGTYTVKASFEAEDGSTVSENTYSFDVFGAGSLTVPESRIAVMDPSDSLKPFLREARIPFVEFDAAADRSLPVFVSRTEATTPEQRK
jgi:hypothetical protein